MQYYPDREAAGNLLADKLEEKYRNEECAVLALSDGAVVVGAVIAKRLSCVINLLLLEPIEIPREPDALAALNNFGTLTYNDKYSQGEIDALRAEYFNLLEQEKIQKSFKMNRSTGKIGVLDSKFFWDRNVIIVADGLLTGFSMRAAADFLKPMRTKKVIMVTPFARVNAVDQMHMLADEIVCLSVFDDLISIDHYYDDNTLPAHEDIVTIIENLIQNWQD